jgi:hypothetical protein
MKSITIPKYLVIFGLVDILFLGLSACSSISSNNVKELPEKKYVVLPIFPGWIEKHLIHYITTDVNDPLVAKEIGVNYVPRFNEVLQVDERFPIKHNVIERIYAVTNFKQPKILPSAPNPIGDENRNSAYSPIWRMYNVTWVEGASPYELQSEEEILQAEDKKLLMISPTSLIVNCAVIDDQSGAILSSARILMGPNTR